MTAHITKTWIEDGKLITEVIEEKEIYKRTWVGLTDEDRNVINRHNIYVSDIINATEAKLKEKNT